LQNLIDDIEKIDGDMTNNIKVGILNRTLPEHLRYINVFQYTNSWKECVEYVKRVIPEIITSNNIETNNIKNNNTKNIFYAKKENTHHNDNKNRTKESLVKNSKFKRNGRCNYCHKKGHYFFECIKRKQDKQNKFKRKNIKPNNYKKRNYKYKKYANFIQKDNYNPIYSEAFSKDYNDNDIMNINLLHKSNQYNIANEKELMCWILDSGASINITNRLDKLTNINKCNEKLYLANNQTLTTKYIGTFKGYINNQEIIIKDVYYSPNIKKNLLSLGKLTQQNYKIIFNIHHNKSYATIFDKHQNKIVNILSDTNNTFKIWVSTQPLHLNNINQINTNNEINYTNMKIHEKLKLWHRRLAHFNIKSIQNKLLYTNINTSKCPLCIESKIKNKPYKESKSFTHHIFELIHMDLIGPLPDSTYGNKYLLTILDDFSRYGWTLFIKNKSDTFSEFYNWFTNVKNRYNTRIKYIRTDNGTEFVNSKFKNFCSSYGIKHQLTIPYNPQQNGRAERFNGTLINSAKTLLNDAKLSHQFWQDAIDTSNYIKNRLPHKGNRNKIPYETLNKTKVDYSNIRVFGCKVFFYLPKNFRSKLDNNASPGIFLGYSDNPTGYKILDVSNNKIILSRNVEFFESNPGNSLCTHCDSYITNFIPNNVIRRNNTYFNNNSYNQILTSNNTDNNNITYNTLNPPHTNKTNLKMNNKSQKNNIIINNNNNNNNNTLNNNNDNNIKITNNNNNSNNSRNTIIKNTHDNSSNNNNTLTITKNNHNDINNINIISNDDPRHTTNSSNKRKQENINSNNSNNKKQNHNENLREPTNFDDIQNLSDKNEWLKSVNEELENMKTLQVFESTEKVPEKANITASRWIFKYKKNSKGEIIKRKSRLVAKGFTQQKGIDYHETFSPTLKSDSIRIFTALAVQNKFNIHQIDINAAYLNAPLKEEIYMKPPKGHEDYNKRYWKLKRAIYGLKQSGKQWNDELHKYLTKIHYKRIISEPCLYIKENKNNKIIGLLAVYVDDILLSGDETTINQTKTLIKNKFKIKDIGKVNYIIGIKFIKHKHGYFLNQTRYIEEILDKFNMRNTTPSRNTKPVEDEELRKIKFDQTKYRSIVGNLLYLAISTRPDIIYSVGRAARKSKNPTSEDWLNIMKILKYLKGTINYGLNFTKQKEIMAYVDADYAGDPDSRRSTTGFLITIGGTPTSWCSKLQHCISTSTAEAEYYSLSECSKHCVWYLNLLNELNTNLTNIEINVDNKAAIYNAKNHSINPKTKHMDIRVHYIRELINNRKIKLKYIKSQYNLADGFTKYLSSAQMDNFRNSILTNINDLDIFIK